MKQEFNPEIINKVNSQIKIDGQYILLYLLSIYYELKVNQEQDSPVRIEAFNLGLVTDVFGKLQLTLPLFKESEEKFEWVSDWMLGFKNINPERVGTKSAVVARMKKFFSENPEVRKHDVYAARDAYFRTVRDAQFVKSSHKFIYEGTGFNRVSMLEQYITQIKGTIQVNGRNQKMR